MEKHCTTTGAGQQRRRVHRNTTRKGIRIRSRNKASSSSAPICPWIWQVCLWVWIPTVSCRSSYAGNKGNTNQSSQDYFKESQERSAQFKKTLLDFCKILKKQNLDGTLGIKLKEPESYTLKDVTEIAQKLQERKQQSESTTGCLGAIRRLFKRALNEKGVLTSMLNFIPNDTYGTLISGGFTMILAVSSCTSSFILLTSPIDFIRL